MQLGKYSTDRDNILHFLCVSEWANASFGNVEAPTGYVWRISNNWEEVKPNAIDFTSVIEDQLALYSIEDTEEFRRSLIGHYLVIEDSNGFVSVLEFEEVANLDRIYSELQDEFYAWDAQDDE
jgi:hypothetical protein